MSNVKYSMNSLNVLLLALLACFAATVMPGRIARAANTAPSSVIAYYFHGNYRCTTCTTLERLSRKAINEKFSKELESGTLAFKSVNVDEPQNRHFIADFGLYTKSLVLVEMQGDKVIKYKNLKAIWTLWKDEPEFEKYVQKEVAAFLKEANADKGKK